MLTIVQTPGVILRPYCHVCAWRAVPWHLALCASPPCFSSLGKMRRAREKKHENCCARRFCTSCCCSLCFFLSFFYQRKVVVASLFFRFDRFSFFPAGVTFRYGFENVDWTIEHPRFSIFLHFSLFDPLESEANVAQKGFSSPRNPF